MRKKGVTDMMTAGRMASNVSIARICMGTLKETDPLEGIKDTPKREPGAWALSAFARPNALRK
jgi:hypothetical protein